MFGIRMITRTSRAFFMCYDVLKSALGLKLPQSIGEIGQAIAFIYQRSTSRFSILLRR